MKRYDTIRKWVTVLLLAGLCGCAKDAAEPAESERVDLKLELGTYAVGDDPNARGNEETVKSAWVYIFNEQGVLENPGRTSVPLTPSGEATGPGEVLNRTWNVAVGAKDIYVLLNAGHVVCDGAAVDLAVWNPFSKAQVERLMTDPANFDADFPAAGSTGMLMSGKLHTTVSAAASSVTVPVARRYARIDLNLRRAPELAGATVIVRKTTLRNRRQKAHVLAPAAESTGTDALRTNSHGDITIGAGAVSYTPVTSFYTLPRTGESKAVCLEVEVVIDGRDDLRRVYINSGALGGSKANDEDQPLDITANTVYKVDATLTRKNTDVELEILEWDEQPVGGDVEGSTLITDPVVSLTPYGWTDLEIASERDSVYVKLSAVASAAGCQLRNADTEGLLGLKLSGGKTRASIYSPRIFLGGADSYLTVVAGNIRRNVPVRTGGTPYLQVTADPLEFDYKGTDYPYKYYYVQSYAELDDAAKTKIAMPWKAEFSLDGGATWTADKPDWLTYFGTEGNGGATSSAYNPQLAPLSGVKSNAENDRLRAAQAVSGTYDLSTQGGKTSVNTANCYIVNAPGTYRFPLVYGNAIKNGATNSSSYVTSVTGHPVLSKLLNHLDAAITNPYIYNNAGCTVGSACLVWQDAPGLVQNIALDAVKRNITFTVPKANIRQGNALIAVRDASGRIMWSWHIWVTPYVLDSDRQPVTNYQGKQYIFMPYNIGWCEGDLTTYYPRSVMFRIRQKNTDECSAAFTIRQNGQLIRSGDNPYFQWGRKDPMLPIVLDASDAMVDKPYYTDIAGYAVKYVTQASGITIGAGIRNPHLIYKTSAAQWHELPASPNLWNAPNAAVGPTDNTVVKTVYDPSPAGYRLPPGNAFTGFTYQGGYGANDLSLINTSHTAYSEERLNFGWWFYRNPMKGKGQYDPSGGTIFFPLTGSRRDASNPFFGVGLIGYCWTADLASNLNFGSSLNIGSTLVNPTNGGLRNGSYPVRPVREN